MSQQLEVETDSHTLKSSLDPTVTNVIETPEVEPAEDSADYEADPADPSTIDPELINTPGLDPENEDDIEGEPDPGLDPDITDPEKPDSDLPTPDDVIREEIDSGIREPNRISNPDAGI